ncbi:MAG TPA: nuclear transport factor 2 family protein [Conexibacter sp.]|jgi:uncharacterized protein (TIGR02246 family)
MLDPLQRLVAQQEIRDLIVTYAQSFDDHDWERFATLWTDDAVFAVEGSEPFTGKQALLGFLTTCLPDDYEGRHMNPQTLIALADDGESATAETDVVWIPQNFENTILARYSDTLVRVDGRWLFKRREEYPIAHRPGPPPQSDTAMNVSGSTMRGEE